MILVLFELEPADHGKARYFDLAEVLRPELDAIDGFISIERFESLSVPGRYLSFSCWRDEAAVTAWRNQAEHRAAQGEGRDGVLRDYRLRVAKVIRDYGFAERTEAPADSRAAHDR